MKKYIILGIFAALIISGIVFAEIPKYISVQGRLTDSNGDPLSGSYTFVFRIYDDQVSGTKLWEETQPLTIDTGIFNANLGSVNSLNLDFDKPYWLEIEVNSEKLNPRVRITSSAFTYSASKLLPTTYPISVTADPFAGFFGGNVNITKELFVNTNISVKKYGTYKKVLVEGENSFDPTQDYGRSGVATDLYEGVTKLIDKYVKKAGDTMTGQLNLPSLNYTGNLYKNGVQGIPSSDMRPTYAESYSDTELGIFTPQYGQNSWVDILTTTITVNSDSVLLIYSSGTVRTEGNDTYPRSCYYTNTRLVDNSGNYIPYTLRSTGLSGQTVDCSIDSSHTLKMLDSFAIQKFYNVNAGTYTIKLQAQSVAPSYGSGSRSTIFERSISIVAFKR